MITSVHDGIIGARGVGSLHDVVCGHGMVCAHGVARRRCSALDADSGVEASPNVVATFNFQFAVLIPFCIVSEHSFVS